MQLVDDYLEFLESRCRANTVLPDAHHLKVFFAAVGKPQPKVSTADVLAFISAQRTGRNEGRVLRAVDPDPLGTPPAVRRP